MLEILGSLIDALVMWGAALGLVIAALIAWGISSILWGEFNAGLFVGIAIPCVIGGVYLQHQIEKGK